jgi:hypothetical protein
MVDNASFAIVLECKEGRVPTAPAGKVRIKHSPRFIVE